MDAILLVVGFAVPWLLGVAVLAVPARRAAAVEGDGAMAWTVGCGWFAGFLLLTLWMRLLSAVGIPFGIASIGGPLALGALALFAVAWRARRGPAWAPAWRTLSGEGLATWERVAWFALLAWLAVRFGLLLSEVLARPIFPWDAWAQWATKAQAWFAMKSMVPFLPAAEWLQSTANDVYFDSGPHYPGTVPLTQAWAALLLGRWDDRLVNLPWWLTGVAFGLALFGWLRRQGFTPLFALTGTWLAVSLPILDVHIALAGYSDLAMATFFTLATVALLQWLAGRRPADLLAAALLIAGCVLVKNPGKVWVVMLVPAVLVALLPRHAKRILGVGIGIALAVLLVLARSEPVILGYRLHLDYDLPWNALADAYLLFGNWHLLLYGAIAMAIVGGRQLLAPGIAPLTMVVASGFLFLMFGFAFTNASLWVEDQSTVNRATLHLAPLLVLWMLLVFRRWAAWLGDTALPTGTAPAEPAPPGASASDRTVSAPAAMVASPAMPRVAGTAAPAYDAPAATGSPASNLPSAS